MTDEERKAWKELVRDIQQIGNTESIVDGADVTAILAADAELKRLREAIEWALENGNYNPSLAFPTHLSFMKSDDWKAELRRRAKEG